VPKSTRRPGPLDTTVEIEPSNQGELNGFRQSISEVIALNLSGIYFVAETLILLSRGKYSDSSSRATLTLSYSLSRTYSLIVKNISSQLFFLIKFGGWLNLL
jgi:hypothetical protein